MSDGSSVGLKDMYEVRLAAATCSYSLDETPRYRTDAEAAVMCAVPPSTVPLLPRTLQVCSSTSILKLSPYMYMCSHSGVRDG